MPRQPVICAAPARDWPTQTARAIGWCSWPVLRSAPGMPELALENSEWMFDPRPDADLHALELPGQGLDRFGRIQQAAFAGPHGDVPAHVAPGIRALGRASAAGIGIDIVVALAHQAAGFDHVADRTTGAAHGVHQARVGVHSELALHPKYHRCPLRTSPPGRASTGVPSRAMPAGRSALCACARPLQAIDAGLLQRSSDRHWHAQGRSGSTDWAVSVARDKYLAEGQAFHAKCSRAWRHALGIMDAIGKWRRTAVDDSEEAQVERGTDSSNASVSAPRDLHGQSLFLLLAR